MSEDSTRQIDAIWILHDASSKRCYLETILHDFEGIIGPLMLSITTIIITQCDIVMKKGDYFQYPIDLPFKVPEHYNDEDEDDRKDLFWVKLMQPQQPFKFAEHYKLLRNPICWTIRPLRLSKVLEVPVDIIENTQKILLYKSLLNSHPFMPWFLYEYEKELKKTAKYIRDHEKIKIYEDEERDGSVTFKDNIEAYCKVSFAE